MSHPRGDVEIMIDGEARRLCLTLGALADLEVIFDCRSIQDLQNRLKQLSARELIEVLKVLLKAANSNCSVDGVMPIQAANAVAEAFYAALE